jgi:hypothetical protein
MSQSAYLTPTIAIQRVMTSACGSVVERCHAVLHDSSHYPLRALRCEFHEGVLSLHGVVPTYYLRQLAQALLSNVENVKEINNKVVVQQRYARFGHW